MTNSEKQREGELAESKCPTEISVEKERQTNRKIKEDKIMPKEI